MLPGWSKSLSNLGYPTRGLVTSTSFSSHECFIKQKQLNFYFIFREKEKVTGMRISSLCKGTAMHSICQPIRNFVFIGFFLCLSSTISKSKWSGSGEHLRPLFQRGDVLPSSPPCWAWREPSAFWYSPLSCISNANMSWFLASILSGLAKNVP